MSPAGAGTFDLRLAVDPPGSNNTVYYEWENEAFTRDQQRSFTQSYTFSQQGTYRITAEIYDVHGKENTWASGNRFDSHSESFSGGGLEYDADAEDVSLSLSTVDAGQSATISVQFQNLSPAGAGTFDLRLAVDPPGFNNTVYYEWENEAFTQDQQRIFTQSYTFSQDGTYRITAEIYDVQGKQNSWVSGNRFDSHSENFSVGSLDYDADAEDVSLSLSTVDAGQSATISVQFQNLSPAGAGTFDLRLAVDPPGFNNTVYYEWENEAFSRNQQRSFTQSHSFSQEGSYQITAEIYDVQGKQNSWASGNRFDSHSESFSVGGLDYDANAEDVSLSLSTVDAGQSATISAQFQNLSAAGVGTFDLRLAVDPPGSNNTVYYEWEDEAFTRNQQRIFTQSYTFSQQGTYRITAEVYDVHGKQSSWAGGNRFDSHSESFSVGGLDYDADAEDVTLSATTVYAGQSETISVQLQNISPAGAGTFDLRLAVDPPGSNNTVYYEWENEAFSQNQQRTFTQSYTFRQEGTYRITTEIYDVNGKENSWASRNRFDAHSERFSIDGVDYDGSVEDISLSPSTLYVGHSSTISVQFHNNTDSSDGAATFDLRLAVKPPDSNNTVHYEWEDQAFSQNQHRTFTQSHTFIQPGTYRITAEIYDIHGKQNNWSNRNLFDAHSERFTMNAQAGTTPILTSETLQEYLAETSCAGKVTITAIDFPAGADQGDLVEGTVTVRNWSDEDWNVELSLEATGPMDLLYKPLRTTIPATSWVNAGQVEDGKEKDFYPRLNLSTGLDAGTYEIHASMQIRNDSTGELCESTDVLGPFVPILNVKDVTPPPIPEATEPRDGAGFITEQEISLGWTGVVDAEESGQRYEVEVSETRSFAASDIVISRMPWSTGYTIDLALPEGTYYWRVRSRDFASPPNISEWSREYRFTVESPEEAKTTDLGIVQVVPPAEFPAPGQHMLVESELRNYSDTDSGRFNLNVFFSSTTESTREPAAAASESDLARRNLGVYDSLPPGGQRTARTEVWVPELTTGPYRLCVEIDYVDLTADSSPSDNVVCRRVTVLPLTGNDFPEPIVPYSYTSLYVEGTFGGGVTLYSEDHPYWIYAPVNYVSMESIDELHDGTFSPWRHHGFGRRKDRVEHYRKIALEIAIKRVKPDEILHIHSGANEFATANELADIGIEVAKTFGHVLGDADLLNEHLRFLHDHGLFDGIAIGTPIFSTLVSAAFNRTIELEQAHATLDMLLKLNMDSAWEEAVWLAKRDLDEMTSPEFMVRWKNELEEHKEEIVVAIATVIGKKLLVKAVTVGAKVAFGHAVVASAPISLTVGLAVAALYFVIDETNEYWDSLASASVAAQIYYHLYSHRFGSEKLNNLRDVTLNYTKFAFYQHLHQSAENWLIKFNLGDNHPRQHRELILARRDLALKELVNGTWLPEEDFPKMAANAEGYPRGIWSNGKTMWVSDRIFLRTGSLYAFDLESKKRDSVNDIGLGVVSVAGIWSSGDEDIIWGSRPQSNEMLAFNIEERERYKNMDFEIPGFTAYGYYCWEGNSILWCGSRSEDTIFAYDRIISKIDAESTIKLDADNSAPTGIWSNGTTIWVADAADHKIYAYYLEGGKPDPARDIDLLKVDGIIENGNPQGIWSDGYTMWVANREYEAGNKNNYNKKRIFAYELPK